MNDRNSHNSSESIVSSGCTGCCAGNIIGCFLMFVIFVGFLRFSARPPFTDIDIVFDMILAAIAGGILGAFLYPLYKKIKSKRG